MLSCCSESLFDGSADAFYLCDSLVSLFPLLGMLELKSFTYGSTLTLSYFVVVPVFNSFSAWMLRLRGGISYGADLLFIMDLPDWSGKITELLLFLFIYRFDLGTLGATSNCASCIGVCMTP